jgi:predicted transcriptional regulator
MTVIWHHNEPVSVRVVVDELAEERAVAYTTAITVIERLRTKGWLVRERAGRSFLYAATCEEHEYAAHLMSSVLEGSGDRSAALLSFAGQLDAAEAEALREALTRTEREPEE